MSVVHISKQLLSLMKRYIDFVATLTTATASLQVSIQIHLIVTLGRNGQTEFYPSFGIDVNCLIAMDDATGRYCGRYRTLRSRQNDCKVRR